MLTAFFLQREYQCKGKPLFSKICEKIAPVTALVPSNDPLRAMDDTKRRPGEIPGAFLSFSVKFP